MVKNLLLIITFLALSVVQVHAASPSPSTSPRPTISPSPTAETTQETTQKLKERIERVVDEKREQIKGVLTELSKKKKGFVGEVQRVSENSITVKTRKSTQIIPLTDKVTITKQNKKIALTDIAIGDWAIVIGGFKDDEFQPERLIISSTSLLPKPQIVMIGSVDGILRNKMTVTSRANAEKKEFLMVKASLYQDSNGDAIKATQVSTGVQALIIAQETDQGTELKAIRLLVPLAGSKNE